MSSPSNTGKPNRIPRIPETLSNETKANLTTLYTWAIRTALQPHASTRTPVVSHVTLRILSVVLKSCIDTNAWVSAHVKRNAPRSLNLIKQLLLEKLSLVSDGLAAAVLGANGHVDSTALGILTTTMKQLQCLWLICEIQDTAEVRAQMYVDILIKVKAFSAMKGRIGEETEEFERREGLGELGKAMRGVMKVLNAEVGKLRGEC